MTLTDFIFLFMIRVNFFYDPSWFEIQFILFLFFYSIRVDLSWSDPDWRSQLIRSDFCNCLAKMFVCPVPKISRVMMKCCRRASHLGRFTLWNNGRRATQLGRFTLWHYGRLATKNKFSKCSEQNMDWGQPYCESNVLVAGPCIAEMMRY